MYDRGVCASLMQMTVEGWTDMPIQSYQPRMRHIR